MQRFCHKCGSEALIGSQFCSKCGAKLWDSDESTEPRLSSNMQGEAAPVQPQRTSEGAHSLNDSQSYLRGNADIGDFPRQNTDKGTFSVSNSTSLRPKSNVRKLAIAALIAVIVIACAVFVIKPAYEHSRDQNEQEKAQQQAKDAQAQFEEEHPVVAGILTNCRSTNNVAIDSSENKQYASITFSMNEAADEVAISQDLDCVRQQVGMQARYEGEYAYLNGSSLWNGFSMMAMDEYKKSNFDIQSATFKSLSDTAIVRCVVTDPSSWMVYCEVGDSSSRSDSPERESGNQSSEGANSSDSVTGGQDDSSSSSNVDHGTPDDAVGYDKYKDYNCLAGNSGRLIPCSEIYAEMGKNMNYLPFGRENANSSGFIPVDENRNGVIDD